MSRGFDEVGGSLDQVRDVLKAYCRSVVSRGMLDKIAVMRNIDIAHDIRDGKWTAPDRTTRAIAAQLSFVYLQDMAAPAVRVVCSVVGDDDDDGDLASLLLGDDT